jgi:ribose-phosphate pyrophosphokinase
MTDSKDDTLVLGFSEYSQQAQALAKQAGLKYAEVNIHHFPDGESKLQLPTDIPEEVILCRSLDRPNEKLIELILAAQGARDLGVKQLTLVAPYLAYMRQDIAFHPGEVVSQKIIGALLANYFDRVITVDSHLHRIHKLSDAIPIKAAINITATKPMGVFLKDHVDNPFLLGPDAESEQWVSSIAKHDNWDYAVAEKKRFGDAKVDVSIPKADYRGRNVILVDDVASTGKTLIKAAEGLHPYQPASINVLVTHALFLGNSIRDLHQAGVSNIWSCDSIPHATNKVSLAGILTKALINQELR